MPSEAIEIGRVVNDRTKEPAIIVTLLPPEDPEAKSGMPPMIQLSSPYFLPVFADHVARLVQEASEKAAELWPEWAGRLVQLTTGRPT